MYDSMLTMYGNDKSDDYVVASPLKNARVFQRRILSTSVSFTNLSATLSPASGDAPSQGINKATTDHDATQTATIQNTISNASTMRDVCQPQIHTHYRHVKKLQLKRAGNNAIIQANSQDIQSQVSEQSAATELRI